MEILFIVLVIMGTFLGGICMALGRFLNKFKKDEPIKERKEIKKAEEKPPQQCYKEKFKSKIEAEKIIALYAIRQKQNKTTHRKESRSYYCEECQAWHLTSKEKTLKESEEE